MGVRVFYEDTKSKTGKHRAVAIALIISESGVVDARKHPQAKPAGKSRGLYSRGYRALYEVDLKPGELAAQTLFVRNPRGWVRGYIAILDPRGREVYRAVVRELKARYSRGDPSLSWAALAVIRHLGLEGRLRRVNLEGPRSRGSSQGG